MSRIFHIGSVLIITVFFCMLPKTVFAWGPATHLDYGLGALLQVSAFLPWIRRLLSDFADDFLYGSIAADITLGKKFTTYATHCHNWKVGLDLLESAPKDQQKAFMLGYLSHLAADTVSHNFFVPYYSMKSFRASLERHTYWELCMDAHASQEATSLIDRVESLSCADNDQLLKDELHKTLFSFKTNKRIFNALLALQRLKRYRLFGERLRDRTAVALSKDDVLFFKALCARSVCDFLTHYDRSYCLSADPTGRLKIRYARENSTLLRTYVRSGQLTDEGERAWFDSVKTALHEGLYQPITLPTLESYV